MQTKDTRTSPVCANLTDTLVLTDDKTPRTQQAGVPLTSAATEQLANMKAWIAGSAMITVLGLRVIEREAGNKHRPFRHTGTSIRYTRRGEELVWSLDTFALAEGVTGKRLEWWAYRAFIASLIETMVPCQRCQGEATNTGGTRSQDLRYSAVCNRCWGRRADPVVIDYILAGGDPTKATIIAP